DFAPPSRRASSTHTGIEIVFGREGSWECGQLRITAMGENGSPNTVSTVSPVSDNAHEAALNHPQPGSEQNVQTVLTQKPLFSTGKPSDAHHLRHVQPRAAARGATNRCTAVPLPSPRSPSRR